MPAQALYLKWRPRTFDHMIGQDHITRTLRNALIQDRIRHAYLFNGPRGTGKTTLARILAKAVNCLHEDPALRPCDECQPCIAINEGRYLDLIEIDAASHNSVDDVRDLRDKIAFAPSEGRFKVYIIDEVHRFSLAAFDALLKTLEEPPGHALFVLATTELDRVPATIRSRSQIFEFRCVSLREVADRLELIINYEHVHVERPVVELVAQLGTGSVRDSISLLDQLITDPDQHITLELAERLLGTAGSRYAGKLAQAIIENDAANGLELLNRAIEQGAEPGQFGRQIVEYLRNLMLVQTGGPGLVDTTEEQRSVLSRQSSMVSRGALLRAVRAFNAALGEVRGAWPPQLPLELALIESTRPLKEEKEEAATTEATATLPSVRKSQPKSTVEPTSDDATSPALETVEAVEPGPISLDDMKQAWPQVLAKIRETQKPIAAQFEKAAVKAVDGKTLILAVQETVFKGMLEVEDKRRLVSKTIKALLGVGLQIKITVAGAETLPLNTVDATIDDDPLLNELREVGGKITQIEDSQGGLD